MAWTEGPGWMCMTHGFFDNVPANITSHINASGPCDVLQLFRTVPTGAIPTGPGSVFPVSGSSGIIYKSIDPASQTYPVGETVLLQYDVGVLAQILMRQVDLPARIVANLYAIVRITFQDGATIDIPNNTNGAIDISAATLDTQYIIAATHRKAIRKFAIIAVNGLVVPTIGNFGLCEVRAHASPLGNATLPA